MTKETNTTTERKVIEMTLQEYINRNGNIRAGYIVKLKMRERV